MANTKQEEIAKVITELEKVDAETKQQIYNYASKTSAAAIVQSFNQRACDLFTAMLEIGRQNGWDEEYKIVSGHFLMFNNAIKINMELPLDKFTLLILSYAQDIYSENEDRFLKMPIPDTKVNVNNEFSVIRSKMFQQLWTVITDAERKRISDVIINLTIDAHAYLYKKIMIISRK